MTHFCKFSDLTIKVNCFVDFNKSMHTCTNCTYYFKNYSHNAHLNINEPEKIHPSADTWVLLMSAHVSCATSDWGKRQQANRLSAGQDYWVSQVHY